MPDTPLTLPEYAALKRELFATNGQLSTAAQALNGFASVLIGLAEHNRISDSDDHLAHPSPCFECETQKLLSRCVMYGHRLRQANEEEV